MVNIMSYVQIERKKLHITHSLATHSVKNVGILLALIGILRVVFNLKWKEQD